MLILAAALAAGQFSAPGYAPRYAPSSSVRDSDARCLATFSYMASKGRQNPQMLEAGKIGAIYFYGKLVGREPGINLVAVLRGAAMAIQPRLQAEIQRCGGELQQAGGALVQVGSALQRR